VIECGWKSQSLTKSSELLREHGRIGRNKRTLLIDKYCQTNQLQP
jgi:hypothetical protein